MLTKVLFFAIATAIVVVHAEKIENDVIVLEQPPKECKVNRTYKIDCNTCICLEENRLACTDMMCNHLLTNRQVIENYTEAPLANCEPGKMYRKSCNMCICEQNGQYSCTLESCPDAPIVGPRDNWGPLWTRGTPCEPNQSFFSECNRCRCGPDGKDAACTKKACPRPSSQHK